MSMLMSEAGAGDAKILSGVYKSIDGEDIDLASYSGKLVLVVNVASKCGFTKQYEGLQKLHEKYSDRGLVVLGFPCGQFAGQEFGEDEQIKAFCTTNYGVTFPIFSKVKVRGKEAVPLFQRLTSKQAGIEDSGAVRWNFEKFLIDRNGKLLGRYRSRVKPESEELISAIQKALESAADRAGDD
jgi:glutathione peroxidase